MSTRNTLPSTGRPAVASPSLLRTLLRPRNLAIAAIALFALLQVISAPIIALAGWQSNPPVLAEPKWDSPQTRALVVRACFDCHSNETTWPWYSKVAPISWLVTRHVIEGRQKLNFSEWGIATGRRRENSANDVTKVIRRGDMPTKDYLLIHPDAQLTDAERQQLIDGLNASLR